MLKTPVLCCKDFLSLFLQARFLVLIAETLANKLVIAIAMVCDRATYRHKSGLGSYREDRHRHRH